MRNSLIALIDGDELCYRVGFATQHVWYYTYDLEEAESEEDFRCKFKYKKQAVEWIGNDDTYWLCPRTETSSEEEAALNLRSAFRTIAKDTNFRDYRIMLSGDNNFRIRLATILPYKGNRPEGSRPIHFDYIKDLLINEYYAEIHDGIEADDAMGIAQCASEEQDTVICSQDKDMNMIPGKHYNPNKRTKFEVDPEEAWKFHYYQILAGDPTDNIPGINRVGMTTAKNLLKGLESKEEYYNRTIELYERALKDPVRNKVLFDSGLSAEELVLEIGSLLYIQQKEDDKWKPL